MGVAELGFALVAAAAAFALSASAGLGGSLILVPALALVLGVKEGIALAALLLALNNVVKVFAYRRTIPLKEAAAVIGLTIAGAALGASLLIRAPEGWVEAGVIGSIGLSVLGERLGRERLRRISAPVLAFGAGAVSGFSGTSGPLKGLALRNLVLDRFHLVGAASVVSLAGDATKTAIFAEASVLGPSALVVAGLATPLMFAATFTGRRLNRAAGERGYAILFWTVMFGYSVRLIA